MSPTPHPTSRHARWIRFAFVATVGAVGFAVVGLVLAGLGRRPERALEVVLRTDGELDWRNEGPSGTLLSDEDLRVALHATSGLLADREDIRRLRGALRVRIEKSPQLDATRIRIQLKSKNAESGQALLERLGQVALMRLHLAPWIKRQQAAALAAQARSAQARQAEINSQGQLYNTVASWIELQESASPVLSRRPELETPTNPRWQELKEKRSRLSSRVETLLETHRRSHPLVSRLSSELERTRDELERTPKMVAQASSPSTSLRQIASTIATDTVVQSPNAPDTEELEAEFKRAWEDVLRSRRDFESSLTAGAQGDADFGTVAWIERPAGESAPTPLNQRRMYLVVLAALAGGLMLATGEHHFRPSFEVADDDEPVARWSGWVDAIVAGLATLTALLAMLAVHALLAGTLSLPGLGPQ